MPILPPFPKNQPPPPQEQPVPVETIGDILRRRLGGNVTQIKGGRRDINRAASPISERQEKFASHRTVIPLCYGRNFLWPAVTTAIVDGSNLVMRMIWGLGEWQEIESVLMDGDAVPAGVTLTHYLGTTAQTADATIAGVISGYSDTLVHTVAGQQIGIAYTVAVVPSADSNGFPRFSIIAKTKKVYDPRTATTVYRNNPSLIYADYLKSTIYGPGLTIPDADLEICADANDELLSGNWKRREMNVVFAKPTPDASMRAALATYAGCFLAPENGGLRMIPDRPASSTRTVTKDDFVEGTYKETIAKRRNRPTVVRVVYTDTSTDPWRDNYAEASRPGVSEGTTPYIDSEIQLPGIITYSQAYREALERLNALWLATSSISIIGTDESIASQIGDVHDLSAVTGSTNKLMRLVAIEPERLGRWAMSYVRYDEAIYSDTVIVDPDDPLPVFAVPEGVIIPYLGGSAPAGWTDYDGANGRFIVGAGKAYNVAATGGSSTLNFGSATVSAGAHTGGVGFAVPVGAVGSNGVTVFRGSSSEGNHYHSVSGSVANALPPYREYRLIRAGDSIDEFPIDGVVFSTTTLTTINNIHTAVDAFLRASAADGATGGAATYASGNLSTSYVQDHRHGEQDAYQPGTNYTSNRYAAAGSHNHTVSGNITLAPKQAYLAAWSDDSAIFAPESGCIVMYEGEIAPSGWRLCDGNNSTVDLRDYFLRVGTTGNMGNKSGSNTASSGSLTTSTNGSHRHLESFANTEIAFDFVANHADFAGGHSHTVGLTGAYRPPYFALTFIQKA